MSNHLLPVYELDMFTSSQDYTEALFDVLPGVSSPSFKDDMEKLGVQGLQNGAYGLEVQKRSGWIEGRVGSLGRPGSEKRDDWWGKLQAMNGLLQDAKDMGNIWGSATNYVAPLGLGSRSSFLQADNAPWTITYNGRPTPDLFVVFLDDGSWYKPFIVVQRIAKLHDKLFRSNLPTLSGDRAILQFDRPMASRLMRNVARGLIILQTAIDEEAAAAEQAELDALADEAALIGTDQEGFERQQLSPAERRTLIERPEYQKYFSTTFNKDLITFVPIIQNFFLTGKYFQNINESFYGSNALALEILVSTIRNNDNYKKEPRPISAAPPSTGAINDQLQQHSDSAKAYILKMLLMTPINILKGLCELIDPHIGLTKIIKRATGGAFDELAEVLNVPAESINEANRTAIEEAEGPDAAAALRGINGDDLLKFILCIMDLSMQTIGSALEDQDGIVPPPPPNFFPDIDRDGVDFTGKVSGLLMIPPTPLGLIYLLLGLIKTDEDGQTTNVLESPEEPRCLPPVADASRDGEPASTDPCEPDQIP
tara:strand:+ start:27138 stop:28754 length:1617 start_codon:yes stop_codon:yes gene_type:complete